MLKKHILQIVDTTIIHKTHIPYFVFNLVFSRPPSGDGFSLEVLEP